MAEKADLTKWILDALVSLGGSGSVVAVTKAVWAAHQEELEGSGDLFFTWQYDIRWAAQKLRNTGQLKPIAGRGKNSRWELPRPDGS